MPINKVIVFKGKGSWTGDATEKKFPGLEYDSGDDFDSILKALIEEKALAILPLWNSHAGEIPKFKIVESVLEKGLRIHAVWPHWIDFACIVRRGTKIGHIQNVVSIGVAEKQCSEFLKGIGARFHDVNSTVDAYKKFSENDDYDAVLCNPELCDIKTQEVLIENVANKVNFTTFVLLGGSNSEEWDNNKLTVIESIVLPKNCQVSCIEMPAISGSLTEEQHEMFDMLSENTEHINEIPKVIFVAKRGYSKIGLILENKRIPQRGDYSELSFSSEVKIINDVGTIKSLYTEEINNFIPKRYADFSKKDFLKHIGSGSCFYACPLLNITVHGFEIEVVETFVRESIVKHFDAIDKGLSCDSKQEELFERHKERYYESGAEFPIFEHL